MGANLTPVDWRKPPDGIEAVSLWGAVHDAKLVVVTSSLLDRSMTMDLEIEHLCEHLKLSTNTRFRMFFQGVRSVRVSTFLPWPGTANVRKNVPRDVQEKEFAAHQAKGREQSISLPGLEEALQGGEISLLDGEMIAGDGGIAVTVEGVGGRADDWFCIVLAAEAVTVKRSDGVELSLRELDRIGQEYWGSQ